MVQGIITAGEGSSFGGQIVYQRWVRRTSPMYDIVNAASTVLYTGFQPAWGSDPGGWWDFLSLETAANGVSFTIRQWTPGTYAIRTDLAGVLYPIGTRIPVTVRSGATQNALTGFHGTLSLGLWGCTLGTDTVQVRIEGIDWHTNKARTEILDVTANEMGQNLAPPGGITAGATLNDFMSPWKMNAGTATAPIARGWLGRWGSTLSEYAWRRVNRIQPLSVRVVNTGTAHGFQTHPMANASILLGGAKHPAFTATTYSPEFFLHAHEPAFATPWPGARKRQLIGVRITPGADGVSPGFIEQAAGYLQYGIGIGRDEDAVGATNALSGRVWVGYPTDSDALSEQKTGDIWGLVNADDPAPDVTGDKSSLDYGTAVEAWWDPGA